MLKCNSFRERAMDDLVDSVGEMVHVNHVTKGVPLLTVGEMNHVSQFDFIIVKTLRIVRNNYRMIASAYPSMIPFIGEGAAIQKINITEETCDRTIYDNFFIKDDYRLTDPTGISELKRLIFGDFKSG